MPSNLPSPPHHLTPAPTLTPTPPAASAGRSCCDDADILSSYCREINAKDVFLAVLTVFLLFFSEEYVIQIVQRLSERRGRGLDAERQPAEGPGLRPGPPPASLSSGLGARPDNLI